MDYQLGESEKVETELQWNLTELSSSIPLFQQNEFSSTSKEVSVAQIEASFGIRLIPQNHPPSKTCNFLKCEKKGVEKNKWFNQIELVDDNLKGKINFEKCCFICKQLLDNSLPQPNAPKEFTQIIFVIFTLWTKENNEWFEVDIPYLNQYLELKYNPFYRELSHQGRKMIENPYLSLIFHFTKSDLLKKLSQQEMKHKKGKREICIYLQVTLTNDIHEQFFDYIEIPFRSREKKETLPLSIDSKISDSQDININENNSSTQHKSGIQNSPSIPNSHSSNILEPKGSPNEEGSISDIHPSYLFDLVDYYFSTIVSSEGNSGDIVSLEGKFPPKDQLKIIFGIHEIEPSLYFEKRLQCIVPNGSPGQNVSVFICFIQENEVSQTQNFHYKLPNNTEQSQLLNEVVDTKKQLKKRKPELGNSINEEKQLKFQRSETELQIFEVMLKNSKMYEIIPPMGIEKRLKNIQKFLKETEIPKEKSNLQTIQAQPPDNKNNNITSPPRKNSILRLFEKGLNLISSDQEKIEKIINAVPPQLIDTSEELEALFDLSWIRSSISKVQKWMKFNFQEIPGPIQLIINNKLIYEHKSTEVILTQYKYQLKSDSITYEFKALSLDKILTGSLSLKEGELITFYYDNSNLGAYQKRSGIIEQSIIQTYFDMDSINYSIFYSSANNEQIPFKLVSFYSETEEINVGFLIEKSIVFYEEKTRLIKIDSNLLIKNKVETHDLNSTGTVPNTQEIKDILLSSIRDFNIATSYEKNKNPVSADFTFYVLEKFGKISEFKRKEHPSTGYGNIDNIIRASKKKRKF